MTDFQNGRINPYATSYGLLTNSDKIKSELLKYIVTLDGDLSYNYKLEGYQLYFILGLNEQEKNLPIFNHPFFFSNHKMRASIAVDLRQYARAEITKERLKPLDISSIREVVRNPVDAGFVVNRALLCGLVATDSLGYIRSSFKPLMVSYALFVSTIINNIVGLNVKDRLTVEIISAYYFFSLLSKETDYDIDELKDVVTNQLDKVKLTITVNKSLVYDVLEPLDKRITNFEDLLKTIKIYIPEAQASLIDVKVFNSLIGNMWMGPGGNELIYIALENVGTWITIFYYSLEELTYKRTRLMEMIKKFGLKNLSTKSKVDIDNALKDLNTKGEIIYE